MIIYPFLLLILGLLLIFVEFYLPGGIMGVVGGLLILLSVISFARETEHPLAIIAFIVLAAVSLGAVVRLALRLIRRSKPGRGIYSWGDQEGYQASSYDRGAIGKVGIVSSDLKPGGHILVEGKSHSAISMAGYLPRGTEVIVVSGEGETLYVKQNKKDKL